MAVILVHGAGSGPWVFDGWNAGEARLIKPDLHAGLDVAHASMHDYAAAVVGAAEGAGRPLALCGWSMGGLVAMMAAAPIGPDFLVLLEASPPLEISGERPGVKPRPGTFDPERIYGRFPPGVRSRLESVPARMERKRGISVPELPCPTLVVYGDAFPDERGRRLAARYGCEQRHLPGLNHWDLVLDPAVPQLVRGFLRGDVP